MTGENGKFESEFNEIRLKIRIEVKIGEKQQHLKGKISQFSKRKFTQSDLKGEEKMTNLKVN